MDIINSIIRLGETIGFQARDYAEKAEYMVRNFTAGKTHETNFIRILSGPYAYRFIVARGGLLVSRRYRLYRAGSAA